MRMLGDIAHHALRLRVAQEAALHADGRAGPRGEVEHVAPAQQLFRAVLVQDGAAVDAGRYRKGDARGHVGLDEAGDDVHGGALRGHNHVDACRARELRNADDALFHFFLAGEHEVGQLVNNDDDAGKLFLAGAELGVIGGELAHVLGLHLVIAVQHFGHGPLQRAGGLVRVAHHGDKQVRHDVVALQLDHLGVDHDHAHLFRRGAEQDGIDDGIDADGFAAARLTGDEQMRHLGQIADDGASRDVASQRHGQG